MTGSPVPATEETARIVAANYGAPSLWRAILDGMVARGEWKLVEKIA